jgi:hypothetical protein
MGNTKLGLVNLTYDIREVEVRPHYSKGIIRSIIQTKDNTLNSLCYNFVRLGIGFNSLTKKNPFYCGSRTDLNTTLKSDKAHSSYNTFRHHGKGNYIVPLSLLELDKCHLELIDLINEQLIPTFNLYRHLRDTNQSDGNYSGFRDDFSLTRFPPHFRNNVNSVGYFGFRRIITNSSERLEGPRYIK